MSFFIWLKFLFNCNFFAFADKDLEGKYPYMKITSSSSSINNLILNRTNRQLSK